MKNPTDRKRQKEVDKVVGSTRKGANKKRGAKVAS